QTLSVGCKGKVFYMAHQRDTIARSVEQMEVVPDEWIICRLHQCPDRFAARHKLRCRFHGVRNGEGGIRFDVGKRMDLNGGFVIKRAVVIPKEFLAIGRYV